MITNILVDALSGGSDKNNNTKNGKCSNCGRCCANYLMILDKEFEEIRKYVEDNHISPHISNDHLYNMMRCPFRDEKNNRCDIHPVKPSICRVYTCAIPSESMVATGGMTIANAIANHLDKPHIRSMRTEFNGWSSEEERKMSNKGRVLVERMTSSGSEFYDNLINESIDLW